MSKPSWWVIIRTPTGRHLIEWGEDPPLTPDMVALRAEHNVPTDWLARNIEFGEDWDVQATLGEPHPEQFWSGEELTAARDGLEEAAGTRDKRAKIETLRGAIKAVGDVVPEAARKAMWDELAALELTFTTPSIDQVRTKLAKDTPPSQATVHRKPPKDPTPTPGR